MNSTAFGIMQPVRQLVDRANELGGLEGGCIGHGHGHMRVIPFLLPLCPLESCQGRAVERDERALKRLSLQREFVLNVSDEAVSDLTPGHVFQSISLSCFQHVLGTRI